MKTRIGLAAAMTMAGLAIGIAGCSDSGNLAPLAQLNEVQRLRALGAESEGAAKPEEAVATGMGWGSLAGTLIYDGTPPAPAALKIDKDPECCKVKHVDESLVVGKGGGLANAVVFVRTSNVRVHPDYEETTNTQVVLDNKTCQFHPHVLGLRVGQTLVIKDSDICSHNTNISPLGGGGTNPLIGAGGSVDYKFPKQQNVPVPVACNIHPWMKAYVLPRDNPYIAVADANGTFAIKDLPAGEKLEFQVWHESAIGGQGALVVPGLTDDKGRFEKTIAENESLNLGELKVPASDFKQ